MNSSNQKNCLIIVHGDEKHEPKWERIIKDCCGVILQKKQLLVNGSRSKHDEQVGFKVPDADSTQDTFILYFDNIEKSGKNKLSEFLRKFLIDLYDYFYENYGGNKPFIDISSYGKTVLSGHFKSSMSDIREDFKKLVSDTGDDGDNKEKIKNFENAIVGKGDFIITNYSIGSPIDKASQLIVSLDKMNDEETIKDIFKKIFDYCWDGKLVGLISNLKSQLFIYWQSNGECGKIEDIKNAIELFKADHNIANERYVDEKHIKPILDVQRLENNVLSKYSQDQKREIEELFDSIIGNIFNGKQTQEVQSNP